MSDLVQARKHKNLPCISSTLKRQDLPSPPALHSTPFSCTWSCSEKTFPRQESDPFPSPQTGLYLNHKIKNSHFEDQGGKKVLESRVSDMGSLQKFLHQGALQHPPRLAPDVTRIALITAGRLLDCHQRCPHSVSAECIWTSGTTV